MIEFEGSIKYGANPSGQGGIPRWRKQTNTILPEEAAAALLTKQIGPELKRSGERMPRAEDKAARGLHCSALNKSRISNVKYLGQGGLAQ